MKIAFDGQLFLKGNKTGVAWSAENIMMQVGKLYQRTEKTEQSHASEDSGTGKMDARWQLCVNYFGLGYGAVQKQALQSFADVGYEQVCCRWFHDVIYRKVWNRLPLPYHLFFGEKADVSVFFNFIIPPGVKGGTVAVVHDMAYMAYPDTVRNKTRKYLERNMEKSCKRATKIITISQFSKSEIQKFLKVPSSKIEVLPLGVDRERFRPDIKAETVEMVKEKYELDGEYILYLGTIEPRKNIKALIQAYGALCRESADAPKLVLAGGKGWFCEEIYKETAVLGITDAVRFLGYVPDEDVPALLRGAELFVFPSLYEGFGLPVLEAMACGTPVLTSNAASLPEVAGEAAVLVDPLNVAEIQRGMATLLLDEKLRQRYREAGFARAGEYSWEKTAKRFMEICEKAVQR